MENKFEKQVKQKMEELDFVPASPVWLKIEEQIRQKKERKRLAFWLPLCLLLAGGSITWFILQHDQQPAGEKTIHQEMNRTSGIKDPLSEITIAEKNDPVHKYDADAPEDFQDGQPSLQPGRKEMVSSDKSGNDLLSNRFTDGLNGQVKKISDNTSYSDAGTTIIDPVSSKQRNEANQRMISENQAHPRMDNITERYFGTRAFPFHWEASERIPVPSIRVSSGASVIPVKDFTTDSNNIVSVPLPKQFGNSRWKFGASIHVGVSGSNNGLPVFQVSQRSADYFSLPDATPPPPALLYNRNVYPSEIREGFSFGAGFVARKQLNKRFAFQTGLEYLYLSTNMKVGYKTNNGSSLSNGSPNGYTSASFNDYKNSFHFLSVPAIAEYQLLKRKPLKVHGGISFQHLVATSALHFDKAARVYVKDRDALNVSQVFSEFGLTYSFPFRNVAISMGPHIRYGFEELENNSENKHLVSVGLKTIFLFQKK